MKNLKKIIQEAVKKHNLKEHKSCSCGCNSCGNLLKENEGEKYKIVYTDYDGFEKCQSKQLFQSESIAENFVRNNKSYSDDFDGITYFNPDDKEYYYGYIIVPQSYEIMVDKF